MNVKLHTPAERAKMIDSFGDFLRRYEATAEITPMLSGLGVTVTGRHVERRDDVRGNIVAEWSIYREAASLDEALSAVMDAALTHILKK